MQAVRIQPLYKFIQESFDESELIVLIFTLRQRGLTKDYHRLPGDDFDEKVRSLIVRCLVDGSRLSLYMALCEEVANVRPAYAALPRMDMQKVLSWWVEPSLILGSWNMRVDNVKDYAFICNGICGEYRIAQSNIVIEETKGLRAKVSLLDQVMFYDDPSSQPPLEDFFLYHALIGTIYTETRNVWDEFGNKMVEY